MILPLYVRPVDGIRMPYVTILLIIANFAVFYGFQLLGANTEFTYAFACVPKKILTGGELTPDKESEKKITIRTPGKAEKEGAVVLPPTPGSVYITLVTCLFLHGSLTHLLGNMWFLYLFGCNIEHYLGHVRYLLVYLLAGVVATVCHVLLTGYTEWGDQRPLVGASGAISGVMGASLFLYPWQKSKLLFFIFLFTAPAWVGIVLWFAFQMIEGAISVSARIGGVAYAAHVGGFLFGASAVVLSKLMRRGLRLMDSMWEEDPQNNPEAGLSRL